MRRAVRRGFRQDLEHRRLHDALPLVAERAVRQRGQRRGLAGAAAAFETTRGSSKWLRFVSRRGRDDATAGDARDRDRRRGSAVS